MTVKHYKGGGPWKGITTALLAGLIGLVGLTGKAQPIGSIAETPEREGNRFLFRAANATVAVEFCTSTMFRVRATWNGSFEVAESLMLVTKRWPDVPVRIANEVSAYRLSTDSIDVVISKSPFSVAVYRKDGSPLTKDAGEGMFRSGDTVRVTRQLYSDEHFFGFGERMDFVDQRNKKLKLNVGRGEGRPHEVGAYNILEANYSPVPFFMSTRGYGIFLHNPYETHWDMGCTAGEMYRFAAVDGELDYYFIYGPRFASIMEGYTSLTGRSPLLPKFAFGLHAGTYSGGTWGYETLTSDRYVIELARKFRELGIPIDLLWLDSTWRIFGSNGGKGATSFEWRETFADSKGMFDSLYAMNYAMVGLHLRPRFDNGKTMNLLDQAREQGFVYPELDAQGREQGEFVNFFDQQSVDWWWENGVRKVADLGARFLKTDEGSAFGGKANESDKTGPTDAEGKRLHNLFPIAYAKAPYEKFQEYNGVRGLNHTREGYAGIQRYPFIFAGDWPSEWQYFLPVIRAGINIGLSGVGYWTHCMGGFEHPADPELYIRWVQMGMFSPLAMVFGMDHPGYKEPWNYGEEALSNFKRYDELRYRLIPFLYSHAYRMYRTGEPLMRGLVWDYQHDRNVYSIDDQYFFGDGMMVCPVTTKGAKTRTVYLPEGSWFDYWTGKPYVGKQYIHVTTPLDTLPVFVKAGTIIPMQNVTQFVSGKPADVITLDIFPGADGRFSLYDDDGTSLDYQRGAFAVTDIVLRDDAGRLTINIGEPQGSFKIGRRRYIMRIRLSGKGRPERVRASSADLVPLTVWEEHGSAGWYHDPSAGVLWIRLPGPVDDIQNLQIDFNKVG